MEGYEELNPDVDKALEMLEKEGEGALHHIELPFGKHKGTNLPGVPVSYLKWLHNQGSDWNPIVEAELKRRGSVIDRGKIDITGHAIDRASLRLMPSFERRKNRDEGLFTWLSNLFSEYLTENPEIKGKDRVDIGRIRFLVSWGEDYPTITSVYWKHKGYHGS